MELCDKLKSISNNGMRWMDEEMKISCEKYTSDSIIISAHNNVFLLKNTRYL